ncbi:cell growth regulator with RING finger domain protein 1-like [Asterias rubens]|uniref:cell growth regulator with RING finger domain protein 1-like n=1 Tax=Asterias rubens TaxID=7604 RepID=UPI00145569AD|nr:cell growth regulator with RING finger domain protein 1-like [Asterias rubens]
MDPEELLVVEAQDATASAICICAIIACIISAVFIIPRINIVSHFVQPELPIVPEVSMVAARNPFTLNILNSNVASLKDGIQLKVKASICSQFQAFWLADCASIQQALQLSCVLFLRDASSLQSHCLHYDQPIVIDAETERQEHLRLPDTVTDTQIQNSMGPPPRTKYPLCVIVRSLEEESQLDSQPQIEGCLYIIHLPDDAFRERCCLISQLIISGTGEIWDVQKLFMATETSQSESVPDNRNAGDASNIDNNPNQHIDGISSSSLHSEDADINNLPANACVVCQNGVVSIALLPCRHTCVCTTCFPLLNKCPMCRGYIESFFSLECDADADWCRRLYDDDAEDDDWPTRFNNSCERFSQWLGFHDL